MLYTKVIGSFLCSDFNKPMLPILDFGFWINELVLSATFRVAICSLTNRKWLR